MGMVFRGTLYRLAVAIKDLGERARLPGLIRIGLLLRQGAL